MTRLVQLVADYGPGELAYAELTQRLALAVPDAVVHLTRVAPGDTLAAGFCVADLALTEGPTDRIVAHDAGAGRLCGGRTREGVWIAGTDAGWSWSFVSDELSRLCRLDASNLAFGCAHVAKGHPHAVCDPVPRASVPPVPQRVVAYSSDSTARLISIAALGIAVALSYRSRFASHVNQTSRYLRW